MNAERAYLARIVEDASSMAERLGPAFAAAIPDADPAGVDDRLARWRRIVADGDDTRFERRLHWDGLDDRTARQALGAVRLRDPECLPRWAELLESALLTADRSPHDRVVRPGAPRPFEEVLLPFIRIARERLGASLPDAPQIDLEAALLDRLSRIADQTLYLEFARFRSARPHSGMAALAAVFGGGGRTQYEAFIQATSGDGLRRLFLRYPVLGRLLATRVLYWLDATREFLQRLDADREILRRIFCGGTDPGLVTGVTPDLSDPHRGGRTVSVVRFASGLRVVYKPRNLAPEQEFSRLIEWLNAGRLDLPLKALTVVNRGTHGWIEFAPAAPCQDTAGVERFYRRAGMLLCLAYVLGGSDFHSGNVIASGEHPVLVDLEVLMRSAVNSEVVWHADSARAIAHTSVVDTALLPLPNFRADGPLRFEGGFVARQPAEMPRRQTWRHVNTDLMAPHEEDVPVERFNVPTLDGVVRRADDHLDELGDGFREMYSALMQHRAHLLGGASPLDALANEQVRVVLRNTSSYFTVLRRTLHPACLKNGADRSIELDVLKGPALHLPTRPRIWPVLTSEHRELEQLDVPMFLAEGTGRRLMTMAGGEVANLLMQPGYDAVRARLTGLGPEDLRRQTHAIRVTFDTSVRTRARAAVLAERSVGHDDGAPLTRAEAHEEARAIVETLDSLALHSDRGGITWLGLSTPSDRSESGLREIGVDLYSGRAGIALFLGAFARITGDPRAHRLALTALEPLAGGADPRSRWRHLASELGIGAGNGLGGLVYALVRIGQWLEHEPLIAGARAAAHAITPSLVASDTMFDVMSGAAGAVLGFLALYKATGDATVLTQASQCGHHLLDARSTDPESGRRAWRTLHGRMTTGFAHGASGIAQALARLHGATGERAFLDGAVEAHAFERSLFVPEARNWLEHASASTARLPDALMCTWCHGAAGIGLARLMAWRAAPDATIEADIAAALEATERAAFIPIDHLCCGNLGRAEFFLSAGRRLRRIDLRDRGLELASQVVRRARARAGYGMGYFDAFCPTLFQGMAGVGYELLRLHDARIARSVLAWH